MSWICKCIFHKDSNDPDGTDCKRSITLYNASESGDAIHRLKCWAIAGRLRVHRAQPKNQSHVGMKWSEVALYDPAVLDKIIKGAQVDLDNDIPWVHCKPGLRSSKASSARKQAAHDLGDQKSSSSSSSSSSESSSSSSSSG